MSSLACHPKLAEGERLRSTFALRASVDILRLSERSPEDGVSSPASKSSLACHPKLAEGERRMVGRPGIEPGTP